MSAKKSFVSKFGGVYEHSPFVAERAYDVGLDERDEADVSAKLRAVVEALSYEEKLTLLRAHPDLAGKLAVGEALTKHSSLEQAGAGLDQCSAEEFNQFQSLNERYVEKFGFPFILAVTGWGRADILVRFAERVELSKEDEFATAMGEVHKIAQIRIKQIFDEK